MKFFFCKNCRFIPAILQKRYRPFLPKNLLYFTVYIFFRTDLVDSFRTCSEGCVICNYSKASETEKCLHIGARFYQVVNQTCNFVAMKYNCLCMFLQTCYRTQNSWRSASASLQLRPLEQQLRIYNFTSNEQTVSAKCPCLTEFTWR